MSRCRRIYSSWQKEETAQARQLAGRFCEVTLLGGWYFPEHRDGKVGRWTGEWAEIYCPEACSQLDIHGHAHATTPTVISCGERVLHQATLRGGFRLQLDLKDVPSRILSLQTEAEYRDRHDPRRLGVFVTGIRAYSGNGEHEVTLDEDFATRLRRLDTKTWVQSLIRITEARSGEDDSLFQEVRGPHSADFEAWLESNISAYDVVLVHGTPFSHSVVTAAAAHAAGVPYVMLPHYHFDDRYYHWKGYYDAFRNAALVLAAPDQSVPLFFDRIDARSLRVPGGAVDAEEFTQLDWAVRRFHELHRRAQPFVLVLGRKEGNKQYRRVIDAVQHLRARDIPVDVVMIGADSDHVPLSSPFVFYYASQPRDMVLGALASCLCLASMSESESFGIVVVEAWMCGKPVIVNRDCLAYAELVEEGSDGVLCRNSEEVAQAVEVFVRDSALASRLGQAGRSKAMQHYTWDRVAQDIGWALREVALSR
jgi:glycosyltransferase involved in cell wall biosynthesis